MDPLDILYRHQVGLVFGDTADIQHPLFKHLVLGIEQALFPFGMRRADGPVESRKEDETGFAVCFKHGSVHPDQSGLHLGPDADIFSNGVEPSNHVER
jgi:hypothetical protein